MLTPPRTARLHQTNQMSVLVFAYWFIWSTQAPLTQILFSGMDRIMTFVTMLVGPTFLMLAVLSRIRGNGHRWPRKANWILLYLAWMGLSLLWSYANNHLFATVVYISASAHILAGVLLCGEENGFRSALNGIITGACAVAFVLAVQLWIDPDVVTLQRLGVQQETAVNANLFGYHIAMGALACLFLYLQGKKRILPLVLFLTAALVATTSKTSIGMFALIMPVFLFRSRVSRRMKLTITAILGAAACLAIPFALKYLVVYEKQDSLSTLTGRLPLWESLIGLIAQRPVLGYGFFSVKDIADTSWGAMHAHNDILQQWVTLGLPGLALAGTLYVIVWRRLRHSSSPYATLGMLWLLFAIGHGLANSDMIALGFPLQMMALFLFPLPSRAPTALHKKVSPARSVGFPSPEITEGTDA